MRRALTREDGFTVAEILVTIAILGIVFAGLAGLVVVQQGGALAAGASGQSAVTRGYAVTQAVNLAQDRLEQVKRLQYTIGPPAVDAIGAGTPAGLPDENPVAGFAGFSRQVRVQAATPVANVKTVTVTVNYTVPSPGGNLTESVVLRTLIAARP